MTILYDSKDSLIEDMLNTLEATTDYLVDMQKLYGEDHKDEIRALKKMTATYKRDFKVLKKEGK